MKATYEDVQQLKRAMAQVVSDFRFRFNNVDVEVVLKTCLETQHGKETIAVKLQEVPATEQGKLPGMNDEAALVDPKWNELRKKFGENNDD